MDRGVESFIKAKMFTKGAFPWVLPCAEGFVWVTTFIPLCDSGIFQLVSEKILKSREASQQDEKSNCGLLHWRVVFVLRHSS